MESVDASLEYISGYFLHCALTWQPEVLTAFGGKAVYPEQDFFDRMMIRLILLITHGLPVRARIPDLATGNSWKILPG